MCWIAWIYQCKKERRGAGFVIHPSWLWLLCFRLDFCVWSDCRVTWHPSKSSACGLHLLSLLAKLENVPVKQFQATQIIDKWCGWTPYSNEASLQSSRFLHKRSYNISQHIPPSLCLVSSLCSSHDSEVHWMLKCFHFLACIWKIFISAVHECEPNVTHQKI